jgi:hypothetical protein
VHFRQGGDHDLRFDLCRRREFDTDHLAGVVIVNEDTGAYLHRSHHSRICRVW